MKFQMETRDIQIMEDIYAENDQVSEDIQKDLHTRGIYAINVLGAPGAGKTSSLIRIVQGLPGVKPYVIEGDIQSDIDTRLLNDLNIETVQINTNGACHLESEQIQGMLSSLSLNEPGILFVENIGNLVCPAEFRIGEDIKILICTVTDGADKPYKYPLAFEKAAAVLLNKADLTPYVDFDMDYFTQGIRALNPQAPIFPVSAKTGAGFNEVCQWIKAKL
jgi:hydrogenase nickel incorporation protein HypB